MFFTGYIPTNITISQTALRTTPSKGIKGYAASSAKLLTCRHHQKGCPGVRGGGFQEVQDGVTGGQKL